MLHLLDLYVYDTTGSVVDSAASFESAAESELVSVAGAAVVFTTIESISSKASSSSKACNKYTERVDM